MKEKAKDILSSPYPNPKSDYGKKITHQCLCGEEITSEEVVEIEKKFKESPEYKECACGDKNCDAGEQEKNNLKELSKCCQAEARVEHGCDSDINSHGEKCTCKIVTCWYECSKCNKPCDVINP